jgi:cytochrome c-type biogenesis protein CcmH/NrfG
MMRGEFKKAIPLLKAARLETPSSPDVLADLGWATWKTGSQEDDEAPGEFLRLALTFDPKHSRALEFLARIAIDQGEHAEAQDRLERFLAVKPNTDWAKAALATVRDLAAVSSSKGGRFWRRGRDS